MLFKKESRFRSTNMTGSLEVEKALKTMRSVMVIANLLYPLWSRQYNCPEPVCYRP